MKSGELTGHQRDVQSVEVSVQVLKAVAAAGGPIALSVISADIGMPAAELIVQRKSGSYDLGQAAAEVCRSSAR